MDRILEVNVRGTFAGSEAALRMDSGGVIINLALLGLTGGQDKCLYGIKTCGRGSTELAIELAPKGIRVVAVAPGVIDTGVQDQRTIKRGWYRHFGRYIKFSYG